MKHTITLSAGVEQTITLSGPLNYLSINQPEGSAPVYVDATSGVTVGKAGALLISAKSGKQRPYQFDQVETLYAICASDAVIVIEELQSFTSPIRKTTDVGTVTEFNFGDEARTFEITNFGDTEIYFAVNRDPDSAEPYTRKVAAESGYYPSYDTPAVSIRVLATAAVEVEVIGYPKDDPVNRRAKKY